MALGRRLRGNNSGGVPAGKGRRECAVGRCASGLRRAHCSTMAAARRWRLLPV